MTLKTKITSQSHYLLCIQIEQQRATSRECFLILLGIIVQYIMWVLSLYHYFIRIVRKGIQEKREVHLLWPNVTLSQQHDEAFK